VRTDSSTANPNGGRLRRSLGWISGVRRIAGPHALDARVCGEHFRGDTGTYGAMTASMPAVANSGSERRAMLPCTGGHGEDM
jgi:hypothetical protein